MSSETISLIDQIPKLLEDLKNQNNTINKLNSTIDCLISKNQELEKKLQQLYLTLVRLNSSVQNDMNKLKKQVDNGT